jgi:predicted GNAT superfamily acetyltransferase
VRRIGVTRIYWTFDPLVARNAHLNLNRLGVRVVEYVPDMYGSDTSSALHRGIGSDRFIVAWPVNGAEPAPRVDRGAAAGLVGASPILNPADGAGIPAMPALSSHPVGPIVRIAVPGAIDEVQAASLSTAGRWRATTRGALTWALGHGYRVRAFYRDDQAGYGYYVLSTTPLPIEES